MKYINTSGNMIKLFSTCNLGDDNQQVQECVSYQVG